MKKLLILLCILGLSLNCFAGNQWQEGTGQDSILGTISPSDIDKDSFENVVDPLDRLTSNYREGCKITYASAATLTVGVGEVVLANAADTIHLMQQNTSTTTVTWADIDTDAEETAKTYYIYAYQATVTDTDFDITISLSSSAPTGKSYFKRLGSFYNDSDGNILNDDSLTNDNDYYALQLGDWESKSVDTVYLASTDGFLLASAQATGGEGGVAEMLTDSSNPPTTSRQSLKASSDAEKDSGTMPVKLGDYYKVTTSSGTVTYIYWVPSE